MRAWASLTVPTFVQLFDKATTTDVTLGTTVPNWIIVVPEIDLTASGLLGISDPDGLPTSTRGVVFENGIIAATTTTQDGTTLASAHLTICIS